MKDTRWCVSRAMPASRAMRASHAMRVANSRSMRVADSGSVRARGEIPCAREKAGEGHHYPRQRAVLGLRGLAMLCAY